MGNVFNLCNASENGDDENPNSRGLLKNPVGCGEKGHGLGAPSQTSSILGRTNGTTTSALTINFPKFGKAKSAKVNKKEQL